MKLNLFISKVSKLHNEDDNDRCFTPSVNLNAYSGRENACRGLFIWFLSVFYID